jgi:dephospho-CoA kinase
MNRSLVLGVTGENRSGKSTTAKYLSDKHGFVHRENSDTLKKILCSLGLPLSRTNLQTVAGALFSSLGKDVIAHKNISDYLKSDNKVFVISGIRYVEEVEAYKKLSNFKLLYINCLPEVRFGRMLELEKKGGGKDSPDSLFSTNEGEYYLTLLYGMSDYVLDNSGSFDSTSNRLDEIIEKELI